eukprot:TRINITY_DN46549_c0_g1_i1.p2 TRINITY_DN46549_c0_g1~~TRINITY_DN46549_c0_g1_i1.p2  ORF type:complete len:298 (+),score=75.97 TRINITY_DN46549_c0_g1_i1:102-995(+)
MFRRFGSRLASAAPTLKKADGAKTRVIDPEYLAEIQVGRYDPHGKGFWLETYHYEMLQPYMVMDLLLNIKVHYDPSFSFRNSCCEGICGSCAVNINGINTLSCITQAQKRTVVLPVPNMPILRDLVCDFRYFFKQYELSKPYSGNPNRDRYHIQNVYERYLQKLEERDAAMPPGPTIEELLTAHQQPDLLASLPADASTFLAAARAAAASEGVASAEASASAVEQAAAAAPKLAESESVSAGLAALERLAAQADKVSARAPPGVLPTARRDIQSNFYRAFEGRMVQEEARSGGRLVV